MEIIEGHILGYTVVIQPLSEQDGGGFAAFIPDLPGCISDGETQEDALRNARDAAECWIDEARELGRPVPLPSSSRVLA